MSLPYIRKTYQVPAKRGARIIWTDLYGRKRPVVILSSDGCYLKVRPDGDKNGFWLLHPTWNIEYLKLKSHSRSSGSTNALQNWVQ